MDFSATMEKLKQFFIGFQWYYIFPILGLVVLIFYVLRVLSMNNAKRIIVAYVLTTVIFGLYFLFLGDGTSKTYMFLLQASFFICVICIFAIEIKRDVWAKRISSARHENGIADSNVCIEEIVKAVQNMSKNNIGAIIILSNGNLPTGVLESGVQINADISSKLIESIFFPKTALHDGALVLNGTKIQAAGCFLPLAQEVNLSKDLGSRHRAGIGLTETVNVTAIIVSEESGIISIAKGGKIIRYIDTTVLRETLKQFYWQEQL
ncbi:MAG: DNA integrity scanning protein DisA nucleotide-binding domain protein [Clostridia bacterium]|nr:DNA integrity scanning protein DisA nucleotide-binding domain protein [Clostridia bacterium]